MKMSVDVHRRSLLEVIAGLGIGVGGRLHRVVDRQGRAVTQLDLPGCDDDVALLDAAEHGHQVPSRRSRGDENLPTHEIGLGPLASFPLSSTM